MSDVTQQIYQAMIDRLNTFIATLSPVPTVKYPGVEFDPPATGRWLEVAFFPNRGEDYALAETDEPRDYRGFLQVTVAERRGGGIPGGLALAGQIETEFARGTSISPARVSEAPYLSAVIELTDRNLYPLTIRYHAYV